MSVIARTMHVLDVLADANLPVTLTELSAATNLPMTTVHRLCAELLSEGVIERAGTGGLRIGSRLWEFGRCYENAERFRMAATRFLHDLHGVTKATVELTLLSRQELVVIDRLPGSDSREAPWHGRAKRLSLEESAPGIAVLAHASPELLDARYAAIGAAKARQLETAIQRTRADGVARHPDVDAQGRIVLAAVVRRRGRIQGAVSMTVPSEQALRSSVPAVLVTARRIGSALVS